MSQAVGPAHWLNPERRLGGTARLFLGFVAGALFALVPMYYFHIGREAGLRSAQAPHEQPLPSGVEASRPSVDPVPARTGEKPFASRLTYELSRPPDERVAALPKAPPSLAVVKTPPPARVPPAALAPPPAPAVAAASPSAERVANARPISVVPLDPRDRTTEIEKEAKKSEYREAPRPQSKAPPTAPRVFEGRAIELKPLSKASDAVGRPAPGESASLRAESDLPVVAGATPIKPPAKGASSVVATAPSTAAATPMVHPAGSGAASSNDVEGLLEASRGWLAASPPTTHTIQLLGTNSEEQLKVHLKSLAKVVEPSQLYVFRTKAQGKPSITVVYGAYVDRQSALRALEKLPTSITANRPVLRTVNGIRTEMKQHNTDG